MVDLLLVAFCVCIRLADTLCDDLGIALLVARVSTILALIAFSREEEFLTKCTEDGLEELSLNKLVTVHLEHVALALADGTLTTETASVEFIRTFASIFLH